MVEICVFFLHLRKVPMEKTSMSTNLLESFEAVLLVDGRNPAPPGMHKTLAIMG